MSARSVSIDGAVLGAFPGARMSGIVVRGMTVGAGFDDAPLPPPAEQGEAEVAAWKQAYSRMGVKPSAVRSSLDALQRMVAKDRSPFGINAAVDTYNAVSLDHALCMGAFDLEPLGLAVAVRFGREGEELVPIGAGKPIPVDERAVVYADEHRVLTAYWNHRDADATKLTPSTRDAVFVVDEIEAQPGRAEAALDDLAARLAAATGGRETARYHLDAARPRASF